MSEPNRVSPPPLPSKLPVSRAKSTAQWVAETVVDLVALVIVGVLAWRGVINGNYALLAVLLLAGVRISDLAGALKNGGGAGGIAGMVIAIGSALAARGGGGHAGYSRVRVLAWIVLATVIGLALCRCSAIRPSVGVVPTSPYGPCGKAAVDLGGVAELTMLACVRFGSGDAGAWPESDR